MKNQIMGRFLLAFMIIATASPTAQEKSPLAQAQRLRVVSLNIGATRLGMDFNPSPPVNLPPSKSLVGLSSFFKKMSAGADNMVVGLQEVDNCLNITDGINQAWYFDDKMGSGWVNRFQRILTPTGDGRLKKYGGPIRDYITGCDNAGYGNAVVSNVTITKTQDWTFAWDPNNPKEYGEEKKGALAVKLQINNRLFWFVNTHLITEIIAAERQIWQILGNIGGLDPSVPVIVVGDFNIRKDGYHTIGGVDQDHKRVYERMTRIFAAAGFVQVGENAGHTFKPWNDYSKLDYIFLFKVGQTFKIDFRIAIPVDITNSKLFYTDHKALIMDLEWQ